MSKASNMLAVLWLLHSRTQMTAAEIAEELENSVRTVYRYIDALCMSGVPIIADSGHDGGFRLVENFKRTPLFFEPSESKAIFHAAEFARRSGYPFSDELDKALQKLMYNASPGQMEYLSRHTESFGVMARPRGGEVKNWLALLEEAVANSETLQVQYHKVEARHPEWRMVDPYGLTFDSGRWYLAVYCHERRDMRDFRVDRIMDVRKSGTNFVRPKNFSVTDYFSNDEMISHLQTGPFTEILVRGSGWAIQSICDHWYLQHCVKERGQQEITLCMNDASAGQIPAMLLAYGTDIEVVEPTAVRKTLSNLARSWAQHHDGNR